MALAYFAYLIVDNYSTVTGSSSNIVNGLPLGIIVIAALGFVIGVRRPQHAPLDSLESERV